MLSYYQHNNLIKLMPKLMSYKSEYQQHLQDEGVNPYGIFDNDVYEDQDLLFGAVSHQRQSGINVVYNLTSNILSPDAFQARQAPTQKKDLPNANTQLALFMKQGMDQQLSSDEQQRSPSEEINQSESWPAPESSMIPEPNSSFSQHSNKATNELLQSQSTQEKGKKGKKEKKIKKEKSVKKEKQAKPAKVAKDPKIPPNQKKRKSSEMSQTESQSGQTAKIEKKKKDQRKNMYPYSFKFIVKAFLSDDYEAFFNKLCTAFGVDGDQVKKFYEQKLAWSISLKDLRSLLNFKQHQVGSLPRKIRECFHKFYVWFLRKRYTIHILTESKIIHKQPYLEAKNYLIYLPDIKIKEKNEQSLQLFINE